MNNRQPEHASAGACIFRKEYPIFSFQKEGQFIIPERKGYSFPRDFFSLFPVVSFVFFLGRFGSPCHSRVYRCFSAPFLLRFHPVETGQSFRKVRHISFRREYHMSYRNGHHILFSNERISTMDLLSQSAAQPLARCLCHQTAQMPNCRYKTSRMLYVRLAGFLVSMKNPNTSFRVKVLAFSDLHGQNRSVCAREQGQRHIHRLSLTVAVFSAICLFNFADTQTTGASV